MRLPDLLGVLAALVVGGLLMVLLFASVVAAPPTLPTPIPPTIPPLPTAPVAVATPGPTLNPSALATTGTSQGLAIGAPAPPLQVTLTDGSLFDTADYAGQPLWINFMATWSPSSADELPMMETYQRDLGALATILVVDVGEDRQTVNAFMRELGVDLPTGVDEDSTVQRAWGANALPIHIFIDKDGVVQEIVYGGAPVEIFDQAVALIVPDFVVGGE
jgi:thiol-disulfide isomerase/thioredoxin